MSLLGLNTSSAATAKHSHQSKEQPLVPELLTCVDQFKMFLVEQKKLREELVNLSQQPLFKLKDDLSAAMHQFSAVTSGLRRIAVQRDHLKEDVLREEKSLGIAQRLSETGMSVQVDTNNAPIEYFLNKMTEFDVRMRSYNQELEILENHVNTQSQKRSLSSKELIALLRKMDDEFICLAAQLHTIWEQVKSLKSAYLRTRPKFGADGRNPFEDIETSSIKLRHLEGSIDNSLLKFAKGSSLKPTPYGPSPFASLSSAGTIPTLGGLTTVISQATPSGIPSLLAPTIAVSSTATPFAQASLSATTFQPSFGLTPSTAAPLTKPAFGFGLTPTTTTATIGFGSSQINPVKPFSFGLTPTSTTDSLFGKRLASKP